MASPVVKFQVFAIDSGSEPLKTTANVTVNIKDVNDNVPFFSKRAYSVILACGTELNSTVVKVKAIDMDLTGSKIKYELPGEMQKYFQVDPMTGFVILIGHLPKSKREVHFNVIARDYGKPPKQAVTRVTVRMAECTEDTSIETIVDQVVEEMTTFHTASSTREPSTMTTSKLKKKMTTTTTPIVIEERAENVAQNKSFNKLDGTTRVFVPRHLTAQVDENSPVGTRIIQIDVNNDTTSYDIHFSTQNADHAKLIKLTKLGELRVADNIDFEKVQFINGSIFARFGKRNLLYATITINVIDKNDNKPVFRLPKSFVLRLPVDTEIGYVLDLPYPLTTDQDVSLDYSTIQYELKENNANGNICFKIDKNSSIIQLVNPIASCGTEKLNLTIKAIDNPGGNPEDINSVNYTLSIEVIEGKNVTSENAAPLNTTSELLSNLSSEIYVFDDEPIGSVLLVISNDEIARNITRTNPLINVSRLSIELSVKNSDVVELTPTSELKLRKSLKGYVNQKLCVQIGAKITIESSIPQSITKNVCLIVKSRPKAPIVHFPLHNSVHKFKENTKYESLLVFNATSTVLDPKLNGLKYGIIESDNNDDWKEFTVDSRGILKAKNTFDYEVKDKYNLQVQICDYNDSCTTVTFRIQVEDLNDHCPSFTNKLETLEILENQPANATGLLVGSFTPAEDADGTAEKWSVCYKLEEEDSIFFLPDTRKPSLFVKKSLDREEMSQYNVTVVALDCHFKERELNCTDDNPRGSYKKLLIINVADVNDNFPKFTQKEYYGNVIERKTKFGAKILQVQARDPDVETRKLHYSMSSAVRTESDVIPKEEAPFHIDAATGNIISHVIYSAKMPHSYNFRVVVKDGAGHEDEASVTISVINYNEQVELVFDQPEDSTRKNQNQIAKLMFDITKMYFVVDEISGHGNSTNMLAHFLEKDKLLASASKALLIFEESKAEQAQRARHELRRTYSLKKIFTDNSEPNMINNAFMAAVEKHAFVIGAVAVGVLTLLFMLMTYMCCHCSSKTSGKMNCSSFNQDLIYGNGNPNSTLGFGLRLPKTETGMVNNMALPNTLQRTSTLAQQRPNNHVQPPPQTHDLMNPKQPGPQNLQMFDALQSTEL